MTKAELLVRKDEAGQLIDLTKNLVIGNWYNWGHCQSFVDPKMTKWQFLDFNEYVMANPSKGTMTFKTKSTN